MCAFVLIEHIFANVTEYIYMHTCAQCVLIWLEVTIESNSDGMYAGFNPSFSSSSVKGVRPCAFLASFSARYCRREIYIYIGTCV